MHGRARSGRGVETAVDYQAVCRFAKGKFTSSDVPKLLTAIRASPYSNDVLLFWFGPFLLVRHGIDNPEVMAELDRLLAHKEPFVRGTTICAFGYGGAAPFYSREEWTASKAADTFGVPRLLRICHDTNELCRDDAWMVLSEIAHRRPEYAPEVLPVLVDLLDEEHPLLYAVGNNVWQVHFSRLAEVNADAATVVMPRLRAILRQLDQQLAVAPRASPEGVNSSQQSLRRRRSLVLEALSAAAHDNPVLSHEIAIEYLGRLRDQQPAGPFVPLLSPDTPDLTRRVVVELLRDTSIAREELALIAKRIHDWRSVRKPSDK